MWIIAPITNKKHENLEYLFVVAVERFGDFSTLLAGGGYVFVFVFLLIINRKYCTHLELSKS